MATKLTAPTKGDLAMLRRVLGDRHVATPDAEVEADIRARFATAAAKGAVPAAGERTIAAWVRAALAIHHRNRALFLKISKGG